MKKTTKRTFGIVRTDFKVPYLDFENMVEDEHGLVFEKGKIMLKSMVSMHIHKTDTGTHYEEIYTLLDDDKEKDVRILILPIEEWESLSTEEVKAMLLEQPQMEAGKEYRCPVGYAHAVVNVRGWLQRKSDYPIIETVKYYPNAVIE